MSCLLRHLFLASILSCALSLQSSAETRGGLTIPDDPVAYIGHGMLIDKEGRIIRADLNFIEKAQDAYIKALQAMLSDSERKAFDDGRAKLFKGKPIDRHNAMLAKATMIEWLLKRAGDLPDGSISGKNSLMKQLLGFEHPELQDNKFRPMRDLGQRLNAADFSTTVRMSTTNVGAAYVSE